MPISGVLLTCQPDQVEAVRRHIADRPHSDVRSAQADTLVVVTDTASLDEDRREVEALDRLSGVIAAQVVFSNVEDLAEGFSAEGAAR